MHRIHLRPRPSRTKPPSNWMRFSRREEAFHAATAHVVLMGHAWKSPSGGDAMAMDENEDLWDALDAGALASAPTMAPAPPAVDDDEDMWDIVS